MCYCFLLHSLHVFPLFQPQKKKKKNEIRCPTRTLVLQECSSLLSIMYTKICRQFCIFCHCDDPVKVYEGEGMWCGGCTVARTVSALVYLLYSIFTYFHKRKRRKKKKEKKKTYWKMCCQSGGSDLWRRGISLCIFFVGWGPHHNLFSSSFAFSPSAFRMYFLGLYWMGSIKRAGEWVGRSLVNGDVILVRNAIQWRNSAGQTTDVTVFLLSIHFIALPCVCVIFSVSSFLFR